MPEISAVIRRLGMEEQVIVKTSPEEKYFAELERVGAGFYVYADCIGHRFGE